MNDTAGIRDGKEAPSLATRLRQEAPVHRVTLPNGQSVWLATRHADVRTVLGDSRLVTMSPATAGDVPPELRAAVSSHMVTANGADHTRLRRLVSAAFTHRRVQGLAPRIHQVADELLDRMAGRGRVDLIAEYALPLPVRVICELLGVPREKQNQFGEWSNAFVTAMGTASFPVAEVTEFLEYLRELIAHKRAAPDDALLSALIAARDDDDRLSENELTSLVFLLLISGHETTVNLIGNGMYLLFADPVQADRLRAEPQGMAAAVEEFLRWEPPAISGALRVAPQPVDVGGTTISAGEAVMFSLLSANRDPAAFSDADRFQPARDHNPHLAFGHGAHYCLGAPLARLEAQIAIGRLLQRYPGLRRAVAPDELRWRPGLFIHGLADLPVVLQ